MKDTGQDTDVLEVEEPVAHAMHALSQLGLLALLVEFTDAQVLRLLEHFFGPAKDLVRTIVFEDAFEFSIAKRRRLALKISKKRLPEDDRKKLEKALEKVANAVTSRNKRVHRAYMGVFEDHIAVFDLRKQKPETLTSADLVTDIKKAIIAVRSLDDLLKSLGISGPSIPFSERVLVEVEKP